MASSKAVTQHRKSRSGCITCKIRKVKCDETRPSCQRCLSTGRICDGYDKPIRREPVVGYLIIRNLPEQPIPADEVRPIQYFKQMTAPSLLNLDSASFWSITVLQICRQEPCLRHLLIAVSIIDEQRKSLRTCANKQAYLQHYGKALRLLSKPNQNLSTVLVGTLLLCIFEDLRSRGFSALQHITSGRNILRNYHQARLTDFSSGVPATETLMDELVPIFTKLERQTWEFDLETLPPRKGQSLTELCRVPAWSCEEGPFKPGSIYYAIPDALFSRTAPFESLAHANAGLYDLRPLCLALRETFQPPATRFHMVPSITHELNMWLESLHMFVRTNFENLSEQDVLRISTLRTFHLCLHIISQTFAFKKETLFDQHSHILENIVLKLSYTLDFVGFDLTPVFWLVATKCRNPAYRRQALDMLRQSGLEFNVSSLRGELLARSAEKLIELEEMGLREVLSCSDVPEQSRVRVVELEVEEAIDSGQKLNVWYRRAPYGETTWMEKAVIDLTCQERESVQAMHLNGVLAFNWLLIP